jgi:hypothetical protein
MADDRVQEGIHNAEMDQRFAQLDDMAAILGRFFDALFNGPFTDEESMTLTRDYLHLMAEYDGCDCDND